MSELFDNVPITMFPVSDIIIPPDRQRKQAKADDTLKASIQAIGLLNPIIIHGNGVLVAGERRLDAFRELNRTHIPARIFEQLPPIAAHLVELQENLAREQLTWQETTSAIAAYHELRLENFAGWTVQGTAADIGFSVTQTYKYLALAKHLDDEDVRGASTLNGAVNLISARADRILAAAQTRGIITADNASKNIIPADASKEEKTRLLMQKLQGGMDEAVTQTNDVLDKVERAAEASKLLAAHAEVERCTDGDERILHASFLDWAPEYVGPKFDVIHCDFPYGKNYKGSNTRKTGRATSTPTYGDAADIYFELVDCFLTHQERFALPQTHCIFWFDMMHYCWTIEQFRKAGWRLVQPFPLIWTKAYQGVASDTQRRPRHCYETALLFSRGDRLIRKLDKDHFEEQVDEKLHLSQKPINMLKHFLRLVVDEHTAVLDPTCGSGTSLAAAGQLGASRLLGIELEASHVDIARFILNRELPNED